MTHMIKTLATVTALAGMVSLAACNTTNGVGKDLKSAGSAVSDASGKTKK